MSKMSNSLGWFLGIAIAGVSVSGHCVHAQITPDGTLPNNSTVNIKGNIFNITGGTQAGSNLFHSFQQFSIPTGSGAFFNNAVDIQNIISRVTGGSISNIDGLIRANGTANLFLINPNGIVFGPNASLNIGGSFVASTANAIQFGNQGFFSASNPNTPALLTVNPSALLFNQIAAAIQNNSVAPAGTKLLAYGSGLGDDLFYVAEPVFGLRVPDGRSLLLLGGNVSVNGGNLNALSGRVELGGVAETGTVGLNVDGNNLHLSFPSGMARADVSLTNGAQVEGGNIQVQGRRITLTNGSEILATAQGAEAGGNLTVSASESVELSSTRFGLGSRLSASSKGSGGNLTIATGRLLVRDGATVSASNSGNGPGGNLTVTASDSVELSGSSLVDSNLSATSEGTEGNLTIATGRLLVRNGARVSAASGFSSTTKQETNLTNRGGNLTVTASDFVELSGSETDRFGSPAGLYTLNLGAGAKGDLTIATRKLIVQDGASVSTSVSLGAGKGGNLNVSASDSVELTGTSADGRFRSGFSTAGYSIGDAGDITIATKRLLLQDGAQISASTFGWGSGGKLTVSASDSVQLIGTSADGQFRSGLLTESTIAPGSLPGRGVATGNAGEITIATKRLQVLDGAQVSASTFGPGAGGKLTVTAGDSVELIGTSADGQFRSSLLTQSNPPVGDPRFGLITKPGNGGDLKIETRQLNVRDGAQVSVSSQGSGDAGNLDVATRSITLDNQAALTAESALGKGGNIQLRAGDLLLLGRNSLMSAVSGNAGSNGRDGNINIDTKFLVAVPLENSDIIATGFGRTAGSNIQLKTQSIFGTQLRQQQTEESDIVASGGVTFSGIVNVDPRLGTVELPNVLADTLNIIDTSCAAFADGKGSQFTVTGRGGLPPNPYEPLSTDVVWSDTRTSAIATQQQARKTPAAKPPSKAEVVEIVPATGWVFNGKGQVTLISHASNANALRSTPSSCPKQ